MGKDTEHVKSTNNNLEIINIYRLIEAANRACSFFKHMLKIVMKIGFKFYEN